MCSSRGRSCRQIVMKQDKESAHAANTQLTAQRTAGPWCTVETHTDSAVTPTPHISGTIFNTHTPAHSDSSCPCPSQSSSSAEIKNSIKMPGVSSAEESHTVITAASCQARTQRGWGGSFPHLPLRLSPPA